MTESFRQPDDWLTNTEYQKNISTFIDSKTARGKFHAQNIALGQNDGIDMDNPAFLPVVHPDYQPPSKALLRSVVDLIVGRGYSKSQISRLLDVSDKRNKTLNNWLSDGKNPIPYTAWLTLTNLAGITMSGQLVEAKRVGSLGLRFNSDSLKERLRYIGGTEGVNFYFQDNHPNKLAPNAIAFSSEADADGIYRALLKLEFDYEFLGDYFSIWRWVAVDDLEPLLVGELIKVVEEDTGKRVLDLNGVLN